MAERPGDETPPEPAKQSLEDFIAALGDDGPAPGAGAAAAVTLALAASCARKAATITRHHSDEPLDALDRQLEAIALSALEGARRDAELFTRFLRRRDEQSAAALREANAAAIRLREKLAELLPRLSGNAHSSVVSDVRAAATLIDAVKLIQERIQADNDEQAEKTRD